MTHASPWECTLGLLKGCGVVLKEGGFLLIYGPYAIEGKISASSNVLFNKMLK